MTHKKPQYQHFILVIEEQEVLQRQFSQNAEADFNFNPEFGGRIEGQYSSVKRHRTHET